MTSQDTAVTAPTPAVDETTEICLNYILKQYELHTSSPKASQPFFIGLNGIQGSGKTTLVSKLATILTDEKGLETLVLSIDDFYLTHAEQVALAQSHPNNKLVQHRGEPGTHSLPLALSTLTSLAAGLPTPIPSYTKSAHSGAGDRAPPSTFLTITSPKIVILEGWCVGYTALSPGELESRYLAAQRRDLDDTRARKSTLGRHALEDLLFVNEELKAYHKLWEFLDTFVFLDARPANAYKWREEQEAALRAQGRGAMTREEVRGFVDAYFPAYELYLRGLRDGDRIQTLMKPGGCGARAEEEGDRRGTLLRVLIDGRREVVGEEWNNWSGPTNATGEWDGDGKGVDREE